jgi:hypothetical protein
MATTERTLLGQLDDYVLDGKHHEATELFCRLATDGGDIRDLVTHVMTTAAPYLHVPAHEKLLPTGEYRNVNYDHTILGLRAGMRLAPYLPANEQHLATVQGVYYVPQGLDVWAQIECGFPGHYAREQERCPDDQTGHTLTCHFADREPLVDGSVEDRFRRMFLALTQGDKVTSYRIFLGLAQHPELRRRLEETLLFAAIIDQQEYNSLRKVRHIGHKAIRTRSMFDLADWAGWDRAHPFFYIGVPDICNAPIFHSLYDHASVLLGTAFKGAQYGLVEHNTTPLTEAEQDRFVGLVLDGDPVAVATEITARLVDGRAVQSLADTVMIAHATHAVSRIQIPADYTVPTHAFDYSNAVNHWLRTFRNPHQAKAVYLMAWFVTETIRDVDAHPDPTDVPTPDPASRQAWADRFALRDVLAGIETAIAAQDPSSAVALVRSYLGRTAERDPLIEQLAHCAGKFQGDAHIFRNARSVIEEYYLNTASPRRKDVLFEYWAHFLAFYRKRTLSTACYELYHQYFTRA